MTHWDLGLSKVQIELDQQAREDHRTLLAHELFWRDNQGWLAGRGYMLRPRYRPGWKPSWEGAGLAWRKHEDGLAAGVGQASDQALFRILICYSTLPS